MSSTVSNNISVKLQYFLIKVDVVILGYVLILYGCVSNYCINNYYTQVCTVLLEDLIGVQVLPKPPPNNPNACEFDINYYPKVFRRGGEKTVRKLISVTVQFDSEPVFKDNLFQAVDWKKAINIQTQRTLKKTFHNADVNALQCMLTKLPAIFIHSHRI